VSERVIEAEVVAERIVACPQCGRSNRLYRRSAAGVYKCGACRAALSNPFPATKAAPSLRTFGIAAAAIIGLLAIIAVIGGNSSSRSPSASSEERARQKAWAERDARIDKLISESGPSALPPIPKPSYYSSTPSTIATIPAVSIESPSPLPRYLLQPAAPPPPEIPTEIPRNGILVDVYPGSTAPGEFTVINGSSRHAIAKVIDLQSDTKILSFAIHAGRRTKITAIPDGTYNVIFAFGERVYVRSDRFEKPRGFSKFDRPFTFATKTTARETEEGTLYTTSATVLEVTLTPVIGGNITTSSISQQEFERY
jgi:hypothetical protein